MAGACIVVLGMHRSGTSALMGILHHLGLELGKIMMAPTEGNPKGYFENYRICALNEKIFHAFGATWADAFLLQDGWWEDAALNGIKREAERILDEEFTGEGVFGIKDPRMCVLYPFWRRPLEERADRLVVALPLRNPFEAVRSLCRREGVGERQAQLLCLQHMLYAEFYSRHAQRHFMLFDSLLRDTPAAIEDLTSALRIDWPCSYEEVSERIEAFIDPGMRHHSVDEGDAGQDYPGSRLVECYRLLQKAAGEGGLTDSDLDRLDDLRADFTAVRDAFITPGIRVHLRRGVERAFHEDGEQADPVRFREET
ncbi:sulfotransferase family protein [Desulfatiglans anilini]|uniref:sulfotransferase family protein n=1 Tax=Desulfatiglans anilini TaxID=90728 RepID=UPI0004261F6A|nr:sulfotransferase family protein [Desulfatiglans anilini]